MLRCRPGSTVRHCRRCGRPSHLIEILRWPGSLDTHLGHLLYDLPFGLRTEMRSSQRLCAIDRAEASK